MSLDELRVAIRAWLDEYDSHPFRKRDDSGRSVFGSEERPLLIPLPETAYAAADWIHGGKARSNCHVAYAHNRHFGPVRVRRLRRGPARRLRHARDMAQGIRTLHAPAPARHGRQPVQHERDRPAREDRMEATGPGTPRAVGALHRPGHDR